jgi:hypothetical protein
MLAHAQGTAGAIQSAPADDIVQLTADEAGLTSISSAGLPRAATYWVIAPGYRGNVTPLPYPCLPVALANSPIYDITGNIFLVDATGGQVLSGGNLSGRQTSSAMIASALALQANTIENLILMVQGAAANASSGMQAMDVPIPGGGGGTNGDGGFYSDSFQPPVYTTNDLWLQMVGTTNNGTDMTAYLVINTPWNVTNGVYDLFATTNLAPSAWQWLGRCSPGQTNLTVVNLASPTEFFILGLTNDTDGDGLTDAYENLVSHTSPTNAYSNLDGLPDSWEASLGLNPQNNNVTMPSERSNYGYTTADWLNGISGVKSGTINLDNEGNVLTVSQ